MAEAFRNQGGSEAIAHLAEPSEHLKNAFLHMLDDLGDLPWGGGARENFTDYLRMLHIQETGIGLRPGIVPMSTFWLVNSAGEVLGESHLRHRLTPELESYGGHIGYFIRLSQRRKGWGTRLLALTLQKAAEVGIHPVRVTCDIANVGSARVIENNGGVLSGYGVSPVNGQRTSQYWIEPKS